jgi:hypothetical protein
MWRYILLCLGKVVDDIEREMGSGWGLKIVVGE